jgi:hypothetical protein
VLTGSPRTRRAAAWEVHVRPCPPLVCSFGSGAFTLPAAGAVGDGLGGGGSGGAWAGSKQQGASRLIG